MSQPLLILPLATQGQAVLSLSCPLTAPALRELEQAFARALQQLRRELAPAADDPGEIEYASWVIEPAR